MYRIILRRSADITKPVKFYVRDEQSAVRQLSKWKKRLDTISADLEEVNQNLEAVRVIERWVNPAITFAR